MRINILDVGHMTMIVKNPNKFAEAVKVHVESFQ